MGIVDRSYEYDKDLRQLTDNLYNTYDRMVQASGVPKELFKERAFNFMWLAENPVFTEWKNASEELHRYVTTQLREQVK